MQRIWIRSLKRLYMAQEKQPLGLPDRVVKITGTPDQLLRAVALLLTKLVESPNYTRFTTSNVSYGPPLAPVRHILPSCISCEGHVRLNSSFDCSSSFPTHF